ncbi:MAG: hypothetical protein COB22_01215 [Cycloclasticus sp.]|nr:MAG: hypothetical protein COB22_01215 [Cycloclasticus sp.]
MRDNPQADDLLKIAEATFRQEILPLLPADKKYTALMIANAMRIAARQFGGTESKITAEITALSEILGKKALYDDPDALLNINKQFAAAIRSGQFASGRDGHDKARQHLLACVQNRLAEVNPKAINEGGGDDR